MNSKKITDKGTTDQIEIWSIAFKKQVKYMRALTGRLSYEQFNYKPAPGSWSVGECLEHLNLSMYAYLGIMNEVVENATLTGNPPYRKGPLLGRVLLRVLRKSGRKYPAPRRFKPKGGEHDPNSVRKGFEGQINRLRLTIGDSAGLALGQITMPWPVFHFVSISLAQALTLLELHNDRHLRQAEQVIQHGAFPRHDSEYL